MTGKRAKIRTTEEKSPVGVCRKTGEILSFWQISVFRGLSRRHIDRVGDQTP